MHRFLYAAAAVFVLVAAVSVITHSANDVIGTTTTAPARHYYLTKTGVTGNGALTAYATGYHFASFAEISDLSDLTYNKTLGETAADSGQGPPFWLRTSASPRLRRRLDTDGRALTCSRPCQHWRCCKLQRLDDRE